MLLINATDSVAYYNIVIACFSLLRHFSHFLLRHFGHLPHVCINEMVTEPPRMTWHE